MVHGKASSISLELLFVLNCAKFPKVEYDKLNTLLSKDLNWDLILHLAMVHAVFPLVYKTISELDNPTVPEHFIQTLQKDYKNSALRAFCMTAEMIRIIKTLEKQGIQPLVLKGVPLAQKLYKDITLRPSGDIDILVDPQKFAIADKVLEHFKYRRIYPDWTMTPYQEIIFLKKFSHFSYSYSGQAIELHWKAIHADIKGFPTLSSIKTQEIDILGHQLRTMADEEWLIYLFIHGCNHMWLRLRWLIDIAIFMQKELDWNKIFYLADNYRIKQMVHLTLILLNELLAIPIPDTITQSIAKDTKAWKLANFIINKLSNIENRVGNSKLSYLKNFIQENNYHISFRTGWTRKLSYFIHMFRPNIPDLQLISLPDKLYWLYFLVRPFYWVKRRFF